MLEKFFLEKQYNKFNTKENFLCWKRRSLYGMWRWKNFYELEKTYTKLSIDEFFFNQKNCTKNLMWEKMFSQLENSNIA